ncbi:quinone oxidoreductase family protein [Altererythrobacter sp. C41]|uniref:quinone oxidoreductase family protein n=1 Tax=Altererythrobacter sp. C41 TaxID=2806021 RepID=UPI0019327E54|nr:zinc-binding dehydrogenase [Altererythrobacter sp. C41]MBM0171244.1 zinc-binding dehydrogenase [Altererythrobacter sp. C41]
MKAAVLHGAGSPDAFVLEDVPVPTIGPEEVLVKVEACGVSYRDVVERNGTYRRDVVWPAVLGLEISGTVAAHGEAVLDLAVGDHVCSKAFISCGACRFCRSGRETTCRRRRPVKGGYAEYVALPQDAFAKVPAAIPFEVSCSLGPGAGVALNALRDTARVQIGETVLVTGATGGVGVPSVQIAKACGARVIAVTRSAAKREFLVGIGADEVVIAGDGENFAGEVRDLTDGEGVDIVVDNVGSRVFDACFDSLAVHGRYAMVGQLFGEDISINPARIFFKRAQILGVGSVSRAQLADAIALAARGIVTPQVSRVLPLSEVAQAHEIVEGGAASGRVVLKP